MGVFNMFSDMPDKPYALAVSIKDFELLTGMIRLYAATFQFAKSPFENFIMTPDQTGVTSEERIEDLYGRLVKQFLAQK